MKAKREYLYMLLAVAVGAIMGILRIYWIVGIIVIICFATVIGVYEYRTKWERDKSSIANMILETIGILIVSWSITSTLASI